jgi:hypothetical protein
MSVNVKNMAGDVINIEIFQEYKIFNLKNELYKRNFIENHLPAERIVLFLNDVNDKEAKDTDFVRENDYFYLFIKDVPTYLILEFVKNYKSEYFKLLDKDFNVVKICGYNDYYKPNIENIHVNILHLKINKKGYQKIRRDLYLFDLVVDSKEDSKEDNKQNDYEGFSNEEVLFLFIKKFVGVNFDVLKKKPFYHLKK